MDEQNERFWSLFAGVILGAEDDGDSDGADGDADGDDEDDESESSDDNADSDGEDESNKPKAPTQADIEKLQIALEKERRLNKRLSRNQARMAQSKTAEESKEQEDLATAQNREREATARAEKLAAGLLQRDINATIEKVARELKFLDPDDAISGVDRTLIESDQDDEDPTDILVNEETVRTAVKALAAKKPHFIRTGTDDGGATGSPFGGRKGGSKKSTDDTLRDLYPALQ